MHEFVVVDEDLTVDRGRDFARIVHNGGRESPGRVDHGLETPLRSQHRPILAITDRVNEAQGTWLGFTARDTDTVMLDKCDSEG